MNYVLLITSLLMIVQAVMVIFVARKEIQSNNGSEASQTSKVEENEQSAQMKKYKRFDMITSVFTMIVLVTTYIYYIWNSHDLKPHFEGRTAVTVSLFMLLYLVYVNTNGYRDIKYLFRTFSSRSNNISIYELAISSEIFGLLVMTINNHFLSMKWAKSSNLSGEVVEIVSKVIVSATLLVMSTSIIITLAFFIKEKNLAKRWKKLHKKIALQVYGNIPSRKSMKKNKIWDSSFLKQSIYFLMDFIYKLPMFVLMLLNKVFAAICGLLYGFVVMIGKICGIAIIDKNNIGQPKAMLNVLWGSIILALSFTYFSIVFSGSYEPSLEKAYSFITGIIVIPTILTVINK